MPPDFIELYERLMNRRVLINLNHVVAIQDEPDVPGTVVIRFSGGFHQQFHGDYLDLKAKLN